MNRATDALHEWMQLRARLRNEHQFHLDQAAADFRGLGLSRSKASRAAARRFGTRRNLDLALRELGGDWAGLMRLFLAHRVHTSPWFQPTVLAMTILLVLLVSPVPLAVIEGAAGEPLAVANRGAVFISDQARNLKYVGVKSADFESILALDSLTGVERYQSIHARAHVRKGIETAAIESQIRRKTGNPRLRAIPLFERESIVMGPAKVVWGLIGIYSIFFLVTFKGPYRWLGYGVAVGCLHWLSSLLTWALATQLCSRINWSTDSRAVLGFVALFALYLGAVALQCRVWRMACSGAALVASNRWCYP